MRPARDPKGRTSAQALSQMLDGSTLGSEFPVDALLESVQAARTIAAAPATGTATRIQLVRLHLDLAAAEIAAAADWTEAAPVTQRPVPQMDAAAGSTGRMLVDRCMRTVQQHLDRGAGTAEHLLACTRAVLHLDAAQRAWPEPERPGRTS
jgi:hypothetical protein